jgi:4-amino-4-deoxy-L-arabinose transferase-like glycosyltransferase
VIANAVAGRWAGVVASALLAFDPAFLRLSYTLQADLPSVAWGLVALALAVEARRHDRPVLWVLAGIALGVAVETKLLALAFLPPMLIIAVTGSRRPRALVGAGLGAGATILLGLLPYLGDLGQVYRGVFGLHIGTGTTEPQPITGKLEVLRYYHPPFATLAAGAVGLVLAAVRRRLWAMVLLAWVLSALAVDLGQAPLFGHHLAVLLPPLAVAGGCGVVLGIAELRSRLPGPGRAVALGLAGLGALLLVVLAPPAASGLPYPDPRTSQVEEAIRALVPPGTPVVTDMPFAAADTGHATPPQLVDVSYARVSTGDLSPAEAERTTEAAPATAVIFVTGRLDSIPGYRDWVQTRYRLASDLGGGVQIWLRNN